MLLLVVIALLLGSLQVSIAQSAGNTCGVAICFAIDESGSIGSADFPKATRFVRDVITGVSEIATGECQVICKHSIACIGYCSRAPAAARGARLCVNPAVWQSSAEQIHNASFSRCQL